METVAPGAERFGRWLSLVMENRGISGTAIARHCKVHSSTVSRWRNGQVPPSMDAVVRLAKFLSIEEPLRLAVTAGIVDGKLLGYEPLPMPEPTMQRANVKKQINHIRGLSAKERQALLDAYDDTSGAVS